MNKQTDKKNRIKRQKHRQLQLVQFIVFGCLLYPYQIKSNICKNVKFPGKKQKLTWYVVFLSVFFSLNTQQQQQRL